MDGAGNFLTGTDFLVGAVFLNIAGTRELLSMSSPESESEPELK